MFPSHFYSYYDQISMYQLVQAVCYARHCVHLSETAFIQRLHHLSGEDRHEWETVGTRGIAFPVIMRRNWSQSGRWTPQLHICCSVSFSTLLCSTRLVFSLLFFMVWGFNKACSHWQIPARDHRECFLLDTSSMSLAKFVPAS